MLVWLVGFLGGCVFSQLFQNFEFLFSVWGSRHFVMNKWVHLVFKNNSQKCVCLSQYGFSFLNFKILWHKHLNFPFSSISFFSWWIGECEKTACLWISSVYLTGKKIILHHYKVLCTVWHFKENDESVFETVLGSCTVS